MAGLDLENRPWYWALILALFIGGALIWASESYWLKNVRQEIVNKTGQLTETQQKVREGKAAEARLPQFREEAERLELELQRLLRILPTMKQTDELIKKVKSLTERGSFRFVAFQPQAFINKDFYSEWPINVRLEGGYHELALFFDSLSRFSRIINVDTLHIAATKAKGPYTINASFTMKTFIYKEPGGKP